MSDKKPGNSAVHDRWWEMEAPDQMASEIIAISDGLESDNASRRTRYLTNLQLYELRALTGLHAAGYATLASPDEVMIPVIRSICDTVQADIAGRQRPVPMFMTSGADWKTRRRAKKLGKFVEAVLHQPQGTYVDGWELAVDVFLDACIYGVGCVHVYIDEGTDKLVLERVQPEEINVDPREAEAGDPLNYFRTHLMDADKCIHAFKENFQGSDNESEAHLRYMVDSATTSDSTLTVEKYGQTRIARVVKVREAIRLPIAKDVEGTHAFAIPGLLLHKEEWKRDCPYVFFRWSRERRGFWAISLVDEVRQLAEELNYNFERMQERMRLCSNKRTIVSQDAGISEEQLEANEAENIIWCTGPAAAAIFESETPALSQADIDWHQLLEQACYKFTGVSQTSATARKEPGIDSGKAIRVMQDLATKRFSIKARYTYEYPFVALARKIVSAVAEYAERTGKDITARLPQRRGIRDIKWSEVNLETELDVQVAPVSSLPNDPAGRLAAVDELFGAGVISMQTYKRLLDWPDLEQEASRENAEWEYVESLLEQYLDADEDDFEDYVPPDGYLTRKEQAMMQFVSAYFEARRDGAPEFNLELLRRYMVQLGALIERAMQPPAPGPEAAAIAGIPGIADPAAAAMAMGAPTIPGAPAMGVPGAGPLAPPPPAVPGMPPGAPGPLPI